MVNSGKVVVSLLLGVGFGVYLFYYGFKRLQLKRTIENMPTSHIRSLALGLVEIYGTVLPYAELLTSKLTNKGQSIARQVLYSPFSNKECLYYKYIIERKVQSGKRSRWVTIKQGSAGRHLLLKDKTGTVLVDLDKAEIDIPVDNEFGSFWGRDPPKQVLQFLKANNVAFEGLFGANHTMRFREYFIAPGDKLYVLGTAEKNPFVKEGTAFYNEEGIMIQKAGNPIYYVSDKDEKSVLSAMKWAVFGSIYGGVVLILLCLAFLLRFFGLL